MNTVILRNIQSRCDAINISLSSVAEKSGVNVKTIYKWGSSMPSADKLAAVAKALRTTSEKLLKE